MNLQLNLSLTLLYDSKSPDRGDDGSDDSGDGTTIMVVMKVMTLVVTVVVMVVMCNSRNNDSLHSEILRWELHSIDTIVTLITP